MDAGFESQEDAEQIGGNTPSTDIDVEHGEVNRTPELPRALPQIIPEPKTQPIVVPTENTNLAMIRGRGRI